MKYKLSFPKENNLYHHGSLVLLPSSVLLKMFYRSYLLSTTGWWCSSQPYATDTRSKGPFYEETTLLELRSGHRLHPRLTTNLTTGTSINLLLRPDTADSPTLYTYLASQLQLRLAQSITTCSRSSWLTIGKNYKTAESTLFTPTWTVWDNTDFRYCSDYISMELTVFSHRDSAHIQFFLYDSSNNNSAF